MAKKPRLETTKAFDADHLLSHLEASDTKEDYLKQVYQIFDMYGLAHGCLHKLGAAYNFAEALWRVTPNDITAICSNLISEDKHPAIKLSENRQFPFDLFDFRNFFYHDPDIEALYIAFKEHDINHAYGLPIKTSDGETFVFVIARPGPPIDTVELLTLQTICSNAVNRLQQFELRPCDINKTKKLSTKERQVLISIANGNSVPEISSKTGMTEAKINLAIDKILSKFKAQNISHATVLALVEGEFGITDCLSE